MQEAPQTGVFKYDLGGGMNIFENSTSRSRNSKLCLLLFRSETIAANKPKKSKDYFLFIESEVMAKLRECIFKNEGKDNRFKCKIMKREAAIITMKKKNA